MERDRTDKVGYFSLVVNIQLHTHTRSTHLCLYSNTHTHTHTHAHAGWVATDLKFKQCVFLKTFKFDNCAGTRYSSANWERTVKFLTKEIRIARDGIQNNKFNHPNVVKFYNAQFRGTAKKADGTPIKDAFFPFVVTELVDGRELQEVLSDYFTALWFRANYPTKCWPIDPTPGTTIYPPHLLIAKSMTHTHLQEESTKRLLNRK